MFLKQPFPLSETAQAAFAGEVLPSSEGLLSVTHQGTPSRAQCTLERAEGSSQTSQVSN